MIKKLLLWVLIPAAILAPSMIWDARVDSRILRFIYTNSPGVLVGLWYGLLIRRRNTRG